MSSNFYDVTSVNTGRVAEFTPEEQAFWDAQRVTEPEPESMDDVERVLPRVRKMLRYDPQTGLLYWRLKTPTKKHPESFLATFRGPGGYGMIAWDGLRTTAARVVWLLHHGAWPTGKLYRYDRDPTNDRIENLEPPKPKRPKGVAKHRGGWQAYAQEGDRRRFLGHFKTEAQAIAARAAYDQIADLV